MIPYGDDQQQIEFPWATVLLIGLCIVVFIWQHVLSHLGPVQIDAGFGMIPARILGHLSLPPDIPRAPALLTPLTASLLHAGFFHLLGNMIFLWVFGKRVEDSFGRTIFIAFVLVTSYAAAIVEIALHGHAQTISIGASGFIAGIMGAYLGVFPFAKISVAFFSLMMPNHGSAIRIPAWLLLGFWIVLQIKSAASHDELVTHVGYLAHIGGFFAGVILARVLLALKIAAVYDEGMAES